MLTEQRERFEQIMGRKMSEPEFERLVRWAEISGLRDNDPVWDMWLGMEFQRSYYEEIPDKISYATEQVIDKMHDAARAEVARAHAALAEAVAASAQKLSIRINWVSAISLGCLGLCTLIGYGALMMYVGFTLGSGKTHPPAMLLLMPAGVLISGLLLITGLGFGIGAAHAYSKGSPLKGYSWANLLIFGLGFFISGALVLQFVI